MTRQEIFLQADPQVIHEQIKMEDFEAAMTGIYSECVNNFTRDESPMVYKPADEIIANISDTVNIDTIIRSFFNL